MMNNNQKIIFELPEDITTIDIISGILKNNGLEESAEEFLNKDDNGQEPRLIIVGDAAIALAQQKIPEEKLIELLGRHLGIQKNIAQNIVKDIKEKLIPYAKTVDSETGQEEGKIDTEDIQEAILEKIRAHEKTVAPIIIEEQAPDSYLAQTPIKDVDKNAEAIKVAKMPPASQSPAKQPEKKLPQQKTDDKYKEPIE